VTAVSPPQLRPALSTKSRVAWYFDFISPYSYLQLAAHPQLFHQLAEAGLELKPLVFAGLLAHWGQKGPVEIPQKRRQTYRMIAWSAKQRGIPLAFPPGHPFNPVPALRLCLAMGAKPGGNMSMLGIVRGIFEFIWKEGRSIGADWPALCERFDLTPAEADALIGAQSVKNALRAHGEEAIALGIYGVPTFAASMYAGSAPMQLFWGEDATELFRAWLADPALFDSAEMRALDALPVAAARQGA
jgi:2-hydroxychromene-2-carboxylate isomerase